MYAYLRFKTNGRNGITDISGSFPAGVCFTYHFNLHWMPVKINVAVVKLPFSMPADQFPVYKSVHYSTHRIILQVIEMYIQSMMDGCNQSIVAMQCFRPAIE